MPPTISTATPLTDERIRDAIATIPSETAEHEQGRWWGTDTGLWMLERITDRIGVPLAAAFAREAGTIIEPADIAHTAVVILSRDTARASIAAADDQWGYLYTTLRNELSPLLTRHGSRELELDRTPCLPTIIDRDGVTLDEAVEKTLACIRAITPVPVQPALPAVVRYFADRGDGRLSHLHTKSAKDAELTSLGLTRPQILALANVVLGARPNHGATSLLGGYLRDASWDPYTSETHRRALTKYRARMLRETAPNLEATAV